MYSLNNKLNTVKQNLRNVAEVKSVKVMNYVDFRSNIANSDMYILSWKIDSFVC